MVRARDQAGRVVLVGENDHYKPLAVRLRKLLADGVIGDLVFAHFTTIAYRLKRQDDWRNDEAIAGGDAFFEEGIHWLHVAGSLGPVITSIHGYRPDVSRDGPDRRVKSMLVAFRYDNGAVGALYHFARNPVAAARSAPVEAVWPARRDHVRIERRVCRRSRRWAAETAACPVFETSAVSRRCTVISWAPFERAGPRR